MPDSITPTSVTYLPPSCLDRATGTDGFPGTPTPAGAITILGADGSVLFQPQTDTFFEEYPDSPTIELAEQATITHRYNCDWITGNSLLSTISRGMLMLDSDGNITRVLGLTGQFHRPGYWDLTMVSEGMSFNNPPDEFSIESIELNPALEKHPRYACLTYAQRYLVRTSNQSQTPDWHDALNGQIATIPNSLTNPHQVFYDQHDAATELLLKNIRGETSFYLPGFRVSWTQYFWLPQEINPGGYIENPVDTAGGSIILPYYFWSTDGNPDGPSIFDFMWEINPLLYGGGISWLRLQDVQVLSRTWFRMTHTWIGAPLGHWDNELYNATVQPYQTSFDQGALSI